MSSTVFDSYISSVYGGGAGLDFFDSIQGGNDNYDIFGGISPAEILDEIDGFNAKTEKFKSDSESDSESDKEEENPDKKSDSESDNDGYKSDSENDSESDKEEEKLDVDKETNIIGYIQIGLHTTPIVESNGDILAPIEIQLYKPKKEKLDAKAVGQALKKIS